MHAPRRQNEHVLSMKYEHLHDTYLQFVRPSMQQQLAVIGRPCMLRNHQSKFEPIEFDHGCGGGHQ